MAEEDNSKQKTCFVVMDFGKKTDFETGCVLDLHKSYRNMIKPAVEAAGLKFIRADEIVHSGLILSNYGYLTEMDGNMETYYSRLKDSNGKTVPADVYCAVADQDANVKTAKTFRGQSYYSSHTDAQYQSLIILLRYLTKYYNFPRKFLPETKRYEATDDVLNFKGIVTHFNYRSDSMWDIGPGFDWDKLINGVQADEFKPKFNSSQPSGITGSVPEKSKPGIQSEEEMEQFLPAAKDASKEDDPYDEAGV